MNIEHVTPAGANIFEDLGLDNSENLQQRAHLMIDIHSYIKEHKLTHHKAAELLETTPTCISDVMQGHIDKCPVEMLLQMVSKIGHRSSD